jgi:hypothetical protein
MTPKSLKDSIPSHINSLYCTLRTVGSVVYSDALEAPVVQYEYVIFDISSKVVVEGRHIFPDFLWTNPSLCRLTTSPCRLRMRYGCWCRFL